MSIGTCNNFGTVVYSPKQFSLRKSGHNFDNVCVCTAADASRTSHEGFLLTLCLLHAQTG